MHMFNLDGISLSHRPRLSQDGWQGREGGIHTRYRETRIYDQKISKQKEIYANKLQTEMVCLDKKLSCLL